MIIYSIIGFICVLLAGLQKKLKHALAYSFLVLTVFLAIRYQFGSDYLEYLRHFELSNDGNLSDAISLQTSIESGWIVLCRIFEPVGFFGMVIALTAFEHLVLYLFIRKHVPPKWYWLAVFCYIFSSTLCLTGTSMMRQFLAMCICLVAFDLALEKKKILFAISLVVLAASFHTSAYICIPFCFIDFLKDIKISKEHIVFLGVVFITALFLFPNMLGDSLEAFVTSTVFEQYESRFEETATRNIGISTFIGYFIFFFILYNQKLQNRANRKFVLIFFWYLIIQSMSYVAPLIVRISFYFYLLFPVCFSNAINKNSDVKLRNIVLFVYMFSSLYGCYSFVTSPGWGQTFLEYKTIFSVDSWM